MHLRLAAVLAACLPLTALAGAAADAKPLVLERGPHHQVLGLVSTDTDEAGRERVTTNTVVQVATGLNYVDEHGALVPARAEFELVDGGAVAWAGQHKVSIAWNANTAEAVQLRLPDGRLLGSHVLGLAYTDTATGESVLIASVQDSEGVLAAPNQLLFPAAFAEIQADLRYTYTLAGFEQDIILRERPPSPAEFGLNPETTRLEVWTEFPEAPVPVKVERRWAEMSRDRAGEPVAGERVDETLDFGTLQLGPGRAFTTEDEAGTLAIVAKQWVAAEDNRTFLVETVAVEAVAEALDRLPPPPDGAGLRLPQRFQDRLQAFRELPRKPGREQAGQGRIRRLPPERMVALAERPGVVLDWIGLNSSQTNRTFLGHETYWITGPVNLFGTNTVFEGGCVIKFTNNVASLKLTVNTPLTWEGSLFRPVVLTAQDDHSVGQKIGSAAQAGQNSYYATTALCLDATTNVVSNFQLAHLRIAHAKTAVELKQKSGHVLSHVQLVNCETGLAPTGAEFALRNALFHNVRTNFNGGTSTGRVEHLTVNNAAWFHHGSTFSQLYLTNSLLVDVGNVGTLVNTNQVAILGGAGGVFTSVLAGSNYLAVGSPWRNAGTPDINPELAADFGQMTTHAPELRTAAFTANTGLTPRVPRDTDLPDLGWHYPALDYVWTTLTVNTGVTLTLLDGVAVAAYGPRLLTLSGTGKLNSTGRPERLNRLVTYHAVQEQPHTWITNGSHITLSGTAVNLRFTDLSYLGGPGRQLIDNTLNNTVTIQDCHLRGLSWFANNTPGSGYLNPNIVLRNNVLERCVLEWQQGNYGSGQAYYLPVTLRHNLFSRTSLLLSRSTTYYGNWAIHDNLFDNATVTVAYFSGSNPIDVVGYNGFINTSNPLGGSGNETGLVRDFVKGPLGNYYYPTNGGATSLTNLLNADTTRTAAGMGLAPYTTTLNQAKDTSHLDIGFHYVALDAYQASTGFSATQGANGWSYRYGGLQGAPVGVLAHYHATSLYWHQATSGANQFCLVAAGYQHPGADYDSLRTLLLPKTGGVRIYGTAADNSNSCGATDGSFLAVMLGARPLTPWINVGDGAVGVPVNTFGQAQAGDYLHFQLNKGTSTLCDSTLWDPLVVQETPVDGDGDGLPDWFEDTNGDGTQNGSDGGGDTDGDGVIDRLDARPLDPLRSTFGLSIDVPIHGSTLAN